MYKITYNETSEVLESLDYVKLQKNNVMVLCDEKEAQGILTKDHSKILAIAGKGLGEQYETVEIQKLTLDQYLEEVMKEPIEKINQLEEQNQILTDCILEISEVVFS